MRFSIALAALPLIAAACHPSPGSTANQTAPAVAAVAAPAGTNWLDTVSATPEGGMRMGNPNAPIKLIEYGSRTCPVCGAFGRSATQPLEKDYVATGKVSWEFREYLVHGQPDFPASLLGTCVPPEAFFPGAEQMYINQAPIEDKMSSPEGQALFQKMQAATPAQATAAWADFLGYPDFFRQRGLTADKVKACLADTGKLDRITQGMQAADAMGVTGTPFFFVNGHPIDALTWGQLEPALKAAGG